MPINVENSRTKLIQGTGKSGKRYPGNVDERFFAIYTVKSQVFEVYSHGLGRVISDDTGNRFRSRTLDSSIGVLDGFAFVVMAVLIAAGVVIVVNVGKLPGQLAHKWGHPQAAAINVMGWIGIATGGLLWPIALIWAFTKPFGIKSVVEPDRQPRSAEPDAATGVTPLRKPAVDEETRS